MKVVYFIATPENFAGSQRVLASVAVNLPGQVEVCALFTGEGRAVDAFRERGIPVHVIPADGELASRDKKVLGLTRAAQARVFARRLVPYTWVLWRFLRRARADLVHCDTSRGVLLIGLAARLARRPVIWHLQGENILELHPHLNRVAAALASRVVRCVDGLRTPPGLPAETIRNGCEGGSCGPSPRVRQRADELLRERGMNPGACFRMVTAATMVPFKGLHHLADAAGALLRERPGLRDRLVWYVLGDARTPDTRRYREFLESRIRENGLERNVFWVGWQQDATWAGPCWPRGSPASRRPWCTGRRDWWCRPGAPTRCALRWPS